MSNEIQTETLTVSTHPAYIPDTLYAPDTSHFQLRRLQQQRVANNEVGIR
jgi:hypothetical protein